MNVTQIELFLSRDRQSATMQGENKIMKKWIWLVSGIALLTTLILCASVSASAETVGGYCGDTYNYDTDQYDNASWSFDTETGLLTVSGKGKMGYWGMFETPWNAYRNQIKSVVIEEGITHISDNSFSYHYAISEIFIPSSVTSIGGSYSAFDECDAWTAVHITDVAAWCKIDFHGGWGNNPIYFAGALYLNGAPITELTVPNGITELSADLFRGCKTITKVNLPEGLLSIEENAFASCTSLSEVQIPNGVRFIGENAFFNCPVLTEENGITYVGNWAIKCDSNITEANVRAGTVGIAEDFIGMNFATRKLYIPSSLKIINKDAISRGYITEVHITDMAAWCTIDFGMRLLSSDCGLYLDGTLVTDLNIPDGVTAISPSAFGNYHELISITFPDSVKSIGNGAFAACENLINVQFSTSIVSIGDRAFSGCTSMESVLLPEGVVSVGAEAFYSCENLKTVSFPRSIAFIGDNAFYSCRKIECVYYPDVATWCGVEIESGNSLPSAINQICYWNGERLSELHIPDGVTAIGNYAFVCCFDLTAVTLPDSVVSIGDCAFYYCKNLKNVQLSSRLTSIGSNAFFDCVNLTDLKVPQSVTSIGAGAFRGCSSLTEVEIPKGITAIEDATFLLCNGLVSIQIPNGVTSIGRNAFYNCGNLIAISIPNSITSIGESAFYKCTKLKTMVFCGTEQQWHQVKKGDYWIAYAENADFVYHDWNDGEIIEAHTQSATGKILYSCTVCEKTKTESIGHSYGNWESANDSSHQKVCACGSTQTSKHVYSNSKDTTCNDCGFTRIPVSQSGNTTASSTPTTDQSTPDLEPNQDPESTSAPNTDTHVGCNSSVSVGIALMLALSMGAVGTVFKKKRF